MKTAQSATIDLPPSEKSEQALVVRQHQESPSPAVTPAQAKVDAIASLTMKAYDRASQLALSAEEVKELSADFPDAAFKPGAAGKEQLIYIEHAFLRDRFNQVFGMGQWAIVPRNRWAEDFVSGKGAPGIRIYVEAMLLVRGCFVGEAVGSMEYYPKNASQDYGDAVEGAKTAAFRRCAKELGVGLQAWKKDWCESWWKRKFEATKDEQARDRNSNTRRLNDGKAAGRETFVRESASSGAPRTPSPATVKSAAPFATPKHRDRMLQRLMEWVVEVKLDGGQARILEYARAAEILIGTNHTLLDWPLRCVPSGDEAQCKHQLDLLKAAITDFVNGGEPLIPFINQEAPAEPEKRKGVEGAEVPRDAGVGTWRDFPIPFGKNAGKKLGQLDKNQLAAYARMMDEECEFETYEDKKTGQTRKKSATSMATNRRLKEALDAWRAERGVESEAA